MFLVRTLLDFVVEAMVDPQDGVTAAVEVILLSVHDILHRLDAALSEDVVRDNDDVLVLALVKVRLFVRAAAEEARIINVFDI